MSFRPRQRLATGRSKYGAVKTTVDGIVFHSAKEARRYGELTLLQIAGEINALEMQVSYPLSVMDLGTGEVSQIGRYVADFRYWTVKKHPAKADRLIVEDVKGFKTPLYRWKKRHVEAQYGIQIREI